MKTKHVVLSLLSLLLCTFLFAGCGSPPPLPEGVTEEDVAAAAQSTLDMLCAEDYAGIEATYDDSMKTALPEGKLKEAWQPAKEQVGNFVEVKEATYYGQKGYAVAVLLVQFEQKKVTFSFSYTPGLQLGGLYFK